MASALIHGGIVLTVDPENRVFEAGWVAVREGRISGVGPASTRPDASGYDEVFDLTGHLVMALVLFSYRAQRALQLRSGA